MKTHIKIGSRESALAVRQAEIVKEILEKKAPGLTVEIITMKTTGDRILHKSLENRRKRSLRKGTGPGASGWDDRSGGPQPERYAHGDSKRSSGSSIYKTGGSKGRSDPESGKNQLKAGRRDRLLQQKKVLAGGKAVSSLCV